MDDETVRVLLSGVEADLVSAARREGLCRSVAMSFREVGDLLWVGGNLLGPDRASRSSPFGFGNDAAVGLATVIQIAGELTAGAVALLEQANLYGVAALIRQLVEVEYLAWAFAEDRELASAWLRSTQWMEQIDAVTERHGLSNSIDEWRRYEPLMELVRG